MKKIIFFLSVVLFYVDAKADYFCISDIEMFSITEKDTELYVSRMNSPEQLLSPVKPSECPLGECTDDETGQWKKEPKTKIGNRSRQNFYFLPRDLGTTSDFKSFTLMVLAKGTVSDFYIVPFSCKMQ